MSDDRRGLLYLFGIASATGGLAIGSLDAAGIATAAGGTSDGAIYTSAYLTILMVTSALAVPHTAKLCARLGIERAYRLVVAVSAIAWIAAGALILLGVPGFPVLLISAPLFGITVGLAGVLAPIFARAYIAGRDMASAFARMSVVAGIAWALGSALGGFILNEVQPGWGLVAKGVFSVPFFAMLLKVRPVAAPSTPKASKRAFPEMYARLKENAKLRHATLLRCGVAVFAAPLGALIVPIVDALRQAPLLPGAGIVLASMAIGQLGSPWLVTKLKKPARPQIAGAAIASFASAILLVLFGIASALISKRPELVVWSVIGLGYGALRYASRALNIGAVGASGEEKEATNLLQASHFAATVVSPLGVLLWGVLINRVSVEAAVFTGAIGTALIALLSLRTAHDHQD